MTRSSIFDNLASIGDRARQSAKEEGRGCDRCGAAQTARRHRNTTYPYPYPDPFSSDSDQEYLLNTWHLPRPEAIYFHDKTG